MKYNYDTVAVWYDRLSRVVFGRAQVNAQLYLLPYIPAGAHILIAGGGTGAILEEITRLHKSGLTITFADTSEKMTALARKRDTGGNKVIFFAAPVQTVLGKEQYDVIITPFLFDNFTSTAMEQAISQLDKHMAPTGLWLYCDFVKSHVLWQQMLLKSMYLFFRLMCGIAATGLPDAPGCLSRHQYGITEQRLFYKGFISAVVYKKASGITGNQDKV